ncbi:MAG TPA: EAL domain-containing protein, partial [Burkholderiaceae bacterium]|nr:EAL domain-containing protein [Burkholderiaceae bacterium]
MRRERTQRLAAQKAAIKALDRVRDTYRASPVGLFTLDESARFIRFNPALCRMLGYPMDHEQPIDWKRHFSNGQYEELCSAKFGGAFEMEWLGRNVKGEERAFLVQAAPGEHLIEGSIQDVTERRKAVERLRFLAEHDPLTELLNRRGIEQVLEHALMGANAGVTAAIAYVDLDRFKLVNDLYGHAVGDEVLRQVTDRMTRVLRGHCAEPLARVGGDEFVVVFEGVSLKRAKVVCEQLARTICDVPVAVGQRLVRIEGSIGLCEVAPGVTVHEAIATADRACRQAKQGQPGSLVVYEQAAGAYKDRALELAIIEQLSSSPALPGLFLEMQPIMSLKAPFDSLNFEVLLRMTDANKQLVPTYKVIGALEASGMMPTVDRWVMRQTLSWLEAHAQQLSKTNFVCMNLSGVSLNDERFIADAMDMLADFPLASRMLCLEITESVALRDLNNTRRWIEQLRGHGVKIALDDFGAGYSSFTYLRDLPADSLKIDGAFIKTINHHPANQAIVQ